MASAFGVEGESEDGHAVEADGTLGALTVAKPTLVHDGVTCVGITLYDGPHGGLPVIGNVVERPVSDLPVEDGANPFGYCGHCSLQDSFDLVRFLAENGDAEEHVTDGHECERGQSDIPESDEDIVLAGGAF